MIQKHRISTNIGQDQKISVELNQNFDVLQILSLKMTQKDVYTSLCSDYGVVCGRISVNNGFGVPNIRISIFVPLSNDDVNDPVISALYPYQTITDKSDDNFRYNLLPSRQQHGGHQPTGTFPDQLDILSREEVLEVYEKYYKYTVKTNESGDFMIWGVPLGEQTLHVDVDLSDIGCFSLRPDDFIRLGFGVDNFQNTYTFKASEDIDSLPQIKTFNKTIEVYPFWGSPDLCDIGITRADFDLSDQGVRIEPKAYLIGGTFTDTGKNTINKNCEPRKKMGRKCDLGTKPGKIEAIRFTTTYDNNNRPVLENYTLNEDISDDGSFLLPLPMNMDYIFTNEFGDNEYTNNPNKGIPTSACYRLRFSIKDSGLDRLRVSGTYLVPNIREYQNQQDSSYSFSTNYDDYPVGSVENYILNNVDGYYVPQDYFYRFTYNKVFTVSSFQGSYFKDSFLTRDAFVGIKELVPSEEEDCTNNVVTPPVNFAVKNYTFSLLIADVLMFFEYLINLVVMVFLNVLIPALYDVGAVLEAVAIQGPGKRLKQLSYNIMNSTQRKLSLINYPDCVECTPPSNAQYIDPQNIDNTTNGSNFCQVGTINVVGSVSYTSRTLSGNSASFSIPSIGSCSTDAHPISDMTYFVDNQVNYGLQYNIIDSTTGKEITNTVALSGTTGTLDYFQYDTMTSTITFIDNNNNFFTNGTTFDLIIVDLNSLSEPPSNNSDSNDCSMYNIPYNDNNVTTYYVGVGRTPYNKPYYSPDIISTLISDLPASGQSYLPTQALTINYKPITPSGQCEFSNGVFSMILGTLSTSRLISILNEYRLRKRVGKLFCGGIANYSFIDNWLSGSLYFFQFKAKNGKYCRDLTYFKNSDQIYYYRSTLFNSETNIYGTPFSNGTNYRLGHPTTIVDLGPRDEFIKEICVDSNLDPNCSVARSIGATTYQSFGDILGYVINYRLDSSQATYDINDFFNNQGFYNVGASGVLDGDILQLISTNCEIGIEEFDLDNPLYLGYDYNYLNPREFPSVFKLNSNVWGPTPITFQLGQDAVRVRLCLNEPGRLAKTTQPVPFYLWDKKGTGFGPYDDFNKYNQSWDYSDIQLQNLQGMTYAYNLTGSTTDQYLLLPVTYTYSGQSFTDAMVTGLTFDFNFISTVDEHILYNFEYPGFTYLYVTSTDINGDPLTGTLYTRYGDVGNWNIISWNSSLIFILPQTQNYYNGNKQILSTPFQYYFGLRPGKTGLDKLIEKFGPKGAFNTVN